MEIFIFILLNKMSYNFSFCCLILNGKTLLIPKGKKVPSVVPMILWTNVCDVFASFGLDYLNGCYFQNVIIYNCFHLQQIN